MFDRLMRQLRGGDPVYDMGTAQSLLVEQQRIVASILLEREVDATENIAAVNAELYRLVGDTGRQP